MENFISVVHILAALFMIIVVLLQGGNSGGVGAAFGGGNSQGVFGASGATSFFAKLTYAVAGIFMVTSISLTYLQGTSGKTGLQDKLKEKAGILSTEPALEQKAPEATPEVKDNTEATPSTESTMSGGSEETPSNDTENTNTDSQK